MLLGLCAALASVDVIGGGGEGGIMCDVCKPEGFVYMSNLNQSPTFPSVPHPKTERPS